MINIDKFRVVNDFPKAGIKFYDITTVMNDAETFKATHEALLEEVKKINPDVIVALETRGYFFGPALALALNLPFVPIRKKGKLPYTTYKQDYQLEYGIDTIEIHTDAIPDGKRVLIFDDILATGGTASAAIKLVNNFKPSHIDVLFLMEIGALQGRARIQGANSITSLLTI
ncbi:MAG: adenine phosphoribosyltransferase [Bacteroidales bacterium]|nr:adenine phosphoribosyltransferase [Bacteroidales bacterium]